MLTTHRLSFLVLALILITSFFFLARREDGDSISHLPATVTSKFTPKPTISDAIVSLFESVRHPITEPYVDPSGAVHRLDATIWSKPLKKRLLILDIDTREPTGENQVFNNKTLNWEELEMRGGQLVSSAIMNHYLYAQIHGYDYKFVQAEHIPDHYDTWISPTTLRRYTPDYDFVVTMDADVTLTHLEVPLEWMFNKWGITRNTSIAMPWDTEEIHTENGVTAPISVDSKGKQVLNTGFMIVQNLGYTLEMLEAWMECTTEKRYKGCGRWKKEWSHEQRAFSEYIRYDFNPRGNNIVALPCDDTMGWPGMVDGYPGRITSDCNGNFVRHHTLDKELAKYSASNSVMQSLSQVLQKTLLRQQQTLYVNQSQIEEEKVSTDVENPDEDDEPVILEGLNSN
ncbi:hypothetical protein BS50DRAFT_569000 [Corynespora cassiicola Philippines]|uniref:Nucleotide-diphospho-sugar transferase domain-containing protein n=1 Tax=Corynespora cassiicola Philippines TaxID=1448308 RepID=A0A2T2P795_CORCC|nr:hypothetical protein BS50DRAFT_569000 [Corynespora cassiicola Philippines]